ncbi:MAG: S8 family serine peptidase, partial [Rhodospirillaceae bacterium]|nr:S8 family serine peptidase [Rhodospirillaceae bacterium]
MLERLFIAALMLVAAVTTALAQDSRPARLGLVDLSVAGLDFSDLDNVAVRTMPDAHATTHPGTRSAVRQDRDHARAHGAEMVRAAVAAFRAVDAATPIEIYVASPFRADARGARLGLSMNELERAYVWFADNNVTLVAQTFVAPDSPAQREAVALAHRLGLVLLASAGNGPDHNAVPPYPAAYDGVISISTTALETELSREADRDAYVDFSVAPKRFTAIVYRRDPELASRQGSSAATASALGILGAAARRWPVADRAEAINLLGCIARPNETFAGRAWGRGVLIASDIGNRLRGLGGAGSPC